MEAYKGLKERTLVVIKPDGVKRAIIGEILQRFEKAGLKIVGLKMITVSRDFARRHYPGTEEWIAGMGKKTLENYEKYNLDAKKELGTDDALKIGNMIYEWNVDAFTSGPVIAVALEGNHAVDNVRMIVGSTLPVFAQPGTIRGDYSSDSAALANKEQRAIKNVVHASGELDEAEREVAYWFGAEDIHEYARADEMVMYGKA